MGNKEKSQSADDKHILEIIKSLRRKRVIDLEHSLAQITELFPEVVTDVHRLNHLRGRARSWEQLPDDERAEATEISMKYLLNGDLDGLKSSRGKLFAYTMQIIRSIQSAKLELRGEAGQ